MQYNPYTMNKSIELTNRLVRFKLDIHQFRGTILKDLQKIYINLTDKARDLDRELVECRRNKRITSKYQILLEEFEQLLDFAEQQVTFAGLINPVD